MSVLDIDCALHELRHLQTTLRPAHNTTDDVAYRVVHRIADLIADLEHLRANARANEPETPTS